MHGDFFEVWFEKRLLTELTQRDVIILDKDSLNKIVHIYRSGYYTYYS